MLSKRDDIVRYLDRRLDIHGTKDFFCNGLHIEGGKQVSRVALAVDACMAVFQKTAALQCQMLLTHHGLICGGLRSITGNDQQKIAFLLKENINLYVAHLPLDKHPTLGNNIQIAKRLGLKKIKAFGCYEGTTIGFSGELDRATSTQALAKKLEGYYGGRSIVLPFGQGRVRRIGIVSGAASDLIPEAAACGLDCFITGESKHHDHHVALEAQMNVIYMGHYASETAGVVAVGRELTRKFSVTCVFIDEPTIT